MITGTTPGPDAFVPCFENVETQGGGSGTAPLEFLQLLSEAESAGRSACATCGTATLGCAPKIMGRRNVQM